MKEMSLPAGVGYVIDKLRERGYEANAVGGCVRDFLIGRPSLDFDVTTSALPELVKRVFSCEEIIETGIKHGTVSLVYEGEIFEITTYRLDGEYTDSRHPSEVSFTDELILDTSRRDFTMNAICYNPYDGYSDFHGGIEDIKRGIIRTVGEPERRFTEDALRIMRAVRFSAVLGFQIEEKTERAIFELSHRLNNISRERIFDEWKKMLSGKFFYEAISKYKGVIQSAIPQLSNKALPSKNLLDAADALVRNIALFDSAEDYETAMRSLKADNATVKCGKAVLENISAPTNTKEAILHLMSALGKETAELLIKTKILLSLSDKSELCELENLLKSGAVYKLSQLKINGKDLEAAGLFGAELGKALKNALCAVMEESVQNEREALMAFVTKKTRRE